MPKLKKLKNSRLASPLNREVLGSRKISSPYKKGTTILKIAYRAKAVKVSASPSYYSLQTTVIKPQTPRMQFTKQWAVSLFLCVVLISSFGAALVKADDPGTQGTIIVTTNVTSDDGGTKQASDFTMDVAATNASLTSFPGSASGVSVNVDPGSYTVTQSSDPGYSAFIPGACSGTIAAGATVHCTIFDNDITPQLTVKTVVDNSGGATSTAADFTDNLTGTKLSSSSFPGSTFGNTVGLSAGSYTVTQPTVAGYATTYSSDCSGSINIGENKTCTITDTDPSDPSAQATIIIKQFVTNNDGGTLAASDFTENASGTNVSSASFPGSSATTITLDPGSYQITQTPNSGYNSFLNSGCSGTIAAGNTKTCSIFTDDITPQLTVINHVVSGTTTAADFTDIASATSPSVASFSGSESGNTIGLSAGAFSVDELNDLGYFKNLSSDCNGTIALGQNLTCTITNSDAPIVPPTPSADLAISINADQSAVDPGGAINYTLTVTNNGTADATNVVATDVLPTSTLSFISSVSGQGAYDSSTGVWPIGTLSANASVTLVISTTAQPETEGQSITNTATVAADQTDSNTANNTATSNGTVNNSTLEITNESGAATASSSDTSITVSWTTSHIATSRVIYDIGSHPIIDTSAAPNYGYAFSTLQDNTFTTNHSVTITGLSQNTDYFLRAVSQGSPETTGDEVSVITTGAGGGSGGGSGGGGSRGSGIVTSNSPSITNSTPATTSSLAIPQVLGASTNIPSSQDPAALPVTGLPAQGLELLLLLSLSGGAVLSFRLKLKSLFVK